MYTPLKAVKALQQFDYIVMLLPGTTDIGRVFIGLLSLPAAVYSS